MRQSYGPVEKLSKRESLVKAARSRALAVLALLALLLPAALLAPVSLAEDLPPIEAKTYDVSVSRKSTSNKVYLFNDVQAVNPPVGKLLLLRQNDAPAMAFRIIKSYPENSQFAAVKVRTYGANTELPTGQVYLAVEKLSDAAPPPTTPEQQADITELESAPAAFTEESKFSEDEIQAYDPELDAGSSPPPGGLASDSTEGSEEGEEIGAATDIGSDEDISIEEIEEIDPYSNWLTFSLGLLSQTVPDLAHPPLSRSTYFTGAGLRYARTVARHPFFNTAKTQDSIALEAGVFYYRVVNLSGIGDAYTLLAPVGTLRYTIQLGESYSVFGYAGAFYHTVISYSGASDTALNTLRGASPALGVGMTFRIGPSWDLRFEAGIDIAALGLMIRY
jgi:hypothetical protein